MGFDDEVDTARRKLEEALSGEDKAFNGLDALQRLLPRLQSKIQSRRLNFQLFSDAEEADGDVFIEILHTASDEALGFVLAEDGEYVFESNLEDYFDDFVDEDADSFTLRLYETLRADLPKYEVETSK
jgi:hypothetical protein